MRVPWLADVLRETGALVHELPGWQGRGKPLERVDAVIFHHTVTPRSVPDEAVARLLRDGRPDLPGPLCQLGLDRSGNWWVIADGLGNHNGLGLYGNQTVGIEAFHDGDPDTPWPGAQLGSWVKGAAAICDRLDLPVERILGHKESDPGRKSDPAALPMDRVRSMVAAATVTATGALPTKGDPDMATTCVPSWEPRQPDGRAPFYRLAADGSGGWVVLSYNHAPLGQVDGDVFGIWFQRLPHLAGRPLGVHEVEASGHIVVVCEDGGVVEVWRR